jgi:hypothetical protein
MNDWWTDPPRLILSVDNATWSGSDSELKSREVEVAGGPHPAQNNRNAIIVVCKPARPAVFSTRLICLKNFYSIMKRNF